MRDYIFAYRNFLYWFIVRIRRVKKTARDLNARYNSHWATRVNSRERFFYNYTIRPAKIYTLYIHISWHMSYFLFYWKVPFRFATDASIHEMKKCSRRTNHAITYTRQSVRYCIFIPVELRFKKKNLFSPQRTLFLFIWRGVYTSSRYCCGLSFLYKTYLILFSSLRSLLLFSVLTYGSTAIMVHEKKVCIYHKNSQNTPRAFPKKTIAIP